MQTKSCQKRNQTALKNVKSSCQKRKQSAVNDINKQLSQSKQTALLKTKVNNQLSRSKQTAVKMKTLIKNSFSNVYYVAMSEKMELPYPRVNGNKESQIEGE